MVILDGCAMMQVLEGQASMLDYFFPRRTDVLVCSSSKLTKIITIEARHISEMKDYMEQNWQRYILKKEMKTFWAAN